MSSEILAQFFILAGVLFAGCAFVVVAAFANAKQERAILANANHNLAANLSQMQEENARLRKALSAMKKQRRMVPAQKPKQSAPARVTTIKNENDDLRRDCLDALVALGTPRRQARHTVEITFRRHNPPTVQEFLRKALVNP